MIEVGVVAGCPDDRNGGRSGHTVAAGARSHVYGRLLLKSWLIVAFSVGLGVDAQMELLV